MNLVYYHNECLDGICSAAIVIKRFGANNVKCVPVQYNRDTWNKEDIEQAETVYVVDFTFPDMKELIKVAGRKLRWIDHHKTAMEQNPDIWGSTDILGIRDLERSGCGLTWAYCFDDAIPYSVRYVEDRDLWRFMFENTKAFCTGLNCVTASPYDDIWPYVLEDNDDLDNLIDVIQVGKALLKAQERRVENLFKSGTDIEFFNQHARVVNSMFDISELGEYIYQRGYEIAVIWHADGDHITVSLRSNVVDCAEIAQMYGGGGHKGAAGFQVDNVGGFPQKLL
jgi:oligoribonuclease NrnB/cAMP/cGMP phosphodiesterase (DHH superfamily)